MIYNMIGYNAYDIDASNWLDIQSFVRAGKASQFFPVGYEIEMPHDTMGSMTWVVRAHDHHVAADESLFHTMTLETKELLCKEDGSSDKMQLDAKEALYYAETELPAGTYHFTVQGATTSRQFTTTKPIPAGGQIFYTSKSVIEIYGSANETEYIESCTTTSGSEGTNLGTTGDGVLNHINRVYYGSNNYAQSALRQWLNSENEAGAVWSPQTKFDRPPSWASERNGFMYGLPVDFLKVVQPVLIDCHTNSAFEVNSLDGAEFTTNMAYTLQDRFFILSKPEVYGKYENNSYKDGKQLEFYKGLTDTERRKYNLNGAAGNCLLRTPSMATAQNIRKISYSDGSWIGSVYPSANTSFTIACVIA